MYDDIANLHGDVADMHGDVADLHGDAGESRPRAAALAYSVRQISAATSFTFQTKLGKVRAEQNVSESSVAAAAAAFDKQFDC